MNMVILCRVALYILLAMLSENCNQNYLFADWLSISTISAANDIKGYPFVNLKSMSDGPIDNGRGIPYIYLTEMDISGNDIKVTSFLKAIATLVKYIFL